MPLYLKIAKRYAFGTSEKGFQFITFISFLSGVGIAIGVAALIIVTSLFNGFRDFAYKEIVGYDPHIVIFPKGINNLSQIANTLDSLSKIYGFHYFKSYRIKVILETQNGFQVAFLNLFDDKQFPNHPIFSKVLYSKNKQSLVQSQGALLGISLANNYINVTQDSISLITLDEFERSVAGFSYPRKFTVPIAGIFYTNNPEYDGSYIFAPATCIANRKVDLSAENLSFDLRLEDLNKIESLAKTLKSNIQNAGVSTWYDRNKPIVSAMKFERISVFFILSLIIVIAVFNVLASLTMTVVKKKSDIAILMAMGGTTNLMKKIFQTQGMIIASISTIVGLFFGLGFTFLQIRYGLIKLNTEKYVISALPMKIELLNVVLIILVTFLISYVSTIYPARRASKTNVSESLLRE